MEKKRRSHREMLKRETKQTKKYKRKFYIKKKKCYILEPEKHIEKMREKKNRLNIKIITIAKKKGTKCAKKEKKKKTD